MHELNVFIRWTKYKCNYCGKCQDACPSGALTIVKDLLFHDTSVCSGCNNCANICPNSALELH